MQTSDPLKKHFKIQTTEEKALLRLGINTIHDLLYHFPTRYSDISELHFIRDLNPGEIATIHGTITRAKTKKSFRTKVPMGEATVEDQTGTISIVWFNQAYLAKMFTVGDSVKVTGKISQTKNGLSITNPEIEKTPTLPIDIHDTLFVKEGVENSGIRYPIYPESRGVTSKYISRNR